MRRDYIDFQDRSAPVGFLLTFRCYGTWLHGDERGSLDRYGCGEPPVPVISPAVVNASDETYRKALSQVAADGNLLLGCGWKEQSYSSLTPSPTVGLMPRRVRA